MLWSRHFREVLVRCVCCSRLILEVLGPWKMEERYEALKELGAGNFGVARLVRDKQTKELVAVKYIERGKKVRSSLAGLGFRFPFVLDFGDWRFGNRN